MIVMRDIWDRGYYCDCPEGPNVGAHLAGTRPRCEACDRWTEPQPIDCTYCPN